MRTRRSPRVLFVGLTAAMKFVLPLLASADPSASERMRLAREESIPLYLRDLEMAGTTFPFSPVTAAILAVSLIVIFKGVFVSGPKSSVTASHILIDDGRNDARSLLERLKVEIGNDRAKFAECAAKHSTCPSGKSASPGGILGTFGAGKMDPAFDEVVFDPKNPIGEVIGPVMTNFGWHLIWIDDRKLVKEAVIKLI